MPNHLHVLFRPTESLKSCVASIKGASAREANRLLGTGGSPFWAKDYFGRRVGTGLRNSGSYAIERKTPLRAGCARPSRTGRGPAHRRIGKSRVPLHMACEMWKLKTRLI